MKKKILIVPLAAFMLLSTFAASSANECASVAYAEDEYTQVDIVGEPTIEKLTTLIWAYFAGSDGFNYYFGINTTSLEPGHTYVTSDFAMSYTYRTLPDYTTYENADEATFSIDASDNITATMITSSGKYRISTKSATQENPAKELFNPDSAGVDHTWGQFENPEATWDKASQTLTIEIKEQSEWQWGNQVFFSTGITTLDTSKEYQISFTGTASTDDCGEVTFKAFDDNSLVFLDQNLSFTTTPYNYVSEWATPLETSTNGCIVFDFGWDAAQTVTITNISIKERSKVSYAITNFDFTTNLYGHKGVSSGSGDNYVSDGDIAVGEKFNEDPAQIEFTVNGSTQTRFWDASSKHELRLYNGATFVLSIVGDYKIIKVEFTGSAVNLEGNGVTVSDKVWEGDATKSVTFVNTATTSKINSIKVTYIAAAPAAANPTITADKVVNVYWEPITVTLACETEGAAIYYTTDGSKPTASATKYTAPFSVTATTTVKAIAIKSGLDNSEVVSKTFTFGTVFASLKDLVEKQPAKDDVAYVQVTITNAEIDSFYVSSKGYTNGVFVTAANTAVELYTNDVPETWEAGGKISGTIKAEWLLYKGTPELQKWDGAWEVFTYTAPGATAMPEVMENANVSKQLINGQLIIIRDNVRYNVAGQQL